MIGTYHGFLHGHMVRIKPPGYGPQVLVHVFTPTHVGCLFLTHSHIATSQSARTDRAVPKSHRSKSQAMGGKCRAYRAGVCSAKRVHLSGCAYHGVWVSAGPAGSRILRVGSISPRLPSKSPARSCAIRKRMMCWRVKRHFGGKNSSRSVGETAKSSTLVWSSLFEQPLASTNPKKRLILGARCGHDTDLSQSTLHLLHGNHPLLVPFIHRVQWNRFLPTIRQPSIQWGLTSNRGHCMLYSNLAPFKGKPLNKKTKNVAV